MTQKFGEGKSVGVGVAENSPERLAFLDKIEPLRKVLAKVESKEAESKITQVRLFDLLIGAHILKLKIAKSKVENVEYDAELKKWFFMSKNFLSFQKSMAKGGLGLWFAGALALFFSDVGLIGDEKSNIKNWTYFMVSFQFLMFTMFTIMGPSRPERRWKDSSARELNYLLESFKKNQRNLLKSLDEAGISPEDLENLSLEAYNLKNNIAKI
jgi:hypothetical protein